MSSSNSPSSSDGAMASRGIGHGPAKPPLPYTAGHTLHIVSHNPPPPLGHPHPAKRPCLPDDVLCAHTQLELCLQHPPLEGISVSDPKELTLKITDTVAVGNGRGAQVVLVDDGKRRLLAKIFDPLYYPTYCRLTGFESDFTRRADFDYSREAASYTTLRALQGGIVPKYYGSWTFDAPVPGAGGGKTTRPVRLILLEYIEGICMKDMEPSKLTENARDNIMVKVLEADSIMHWEGVDHRDIHPRNVIISKSDNFEDPNLRVVIVDFNIAKIHLIIFGKSRKSQGELPISPLERYQFGLPEYSSLGWIPENGVDWLLKQWGNDSNYDPVKWWKDLQEESELE